jgi:outer membrane lipoprotein-sorting protein
MALIKNTDMKAFVLFIFSLIGFSAGAQQDANLSLVQDPAAVPYLENLSKLFADNSAFQVEFKYKLISKANDATVTDFGSVIVKGQKYKMKTDDTEVYYNGTTLWSYNVPAGEVYVSQPDSSTAVENLTDPFRLMGNYKEYYKYQYKGQKTVDGKTFDEIDLYPANIDVSYSILRLLVFNGGKSLYSLTIQQKNGIDIEVYVDDVIRNLNITDKTFEWNEADHPDVLVVEM